MRSSGSILLCSALTAFTPCQSFVTLSAVKLQLISPCRLPGSRPDTTRTVSTRSPWMAWGTPGSRESKREVAKSELLEAISSLERGLIASEEDQARIDTLAQQLESVNPTKAALASPLINGRWELKYTTSASILGREKLARLRPRGPIYQDIDAIGLRARNLSKIKPLPFVTVGNSVRAALTPTSESAVNVQFLQFMVGPIKIKAPERAKGALDTTYLDEDLRVSRGDKGNLFILTKTDLEPEL